MIHRRVTLFACLVAAGLAALSAQDAPRSVPDEGIVDERTGDSADSELEALLESALSAAERGEWDAALAFLDEAGEIDASDPRISSYRQSILELKAVDMAQDSWAGGEPANVSGTEPESGTDEEGGTDEPKFTLDRGERDRSRNPAISRDRFRSEASFKIVAVNPEESSGNNVWGSAAEFFYASLRTELRYWTPFLGRSLGFNFRNNGYSWLPGSPAILFSALDFGVNIRGFVLESMTSRLEVGLDFGISMNTLKIVNGSVERRGALYLGLWISDPVIYHLFGLESFENMVFGMGLRIYSSAADDLLERIVYRFDGEWRLEHWSIGSRLEWWDLGELTENKNLMSVSVYAGYRF